MRGTVNKWNSKKQFGFVKGFDNKSYFLHMAEVSEADKDFIRNTQIVEFEIENTEKGLRAVNVFAAKSESQIESLELISNLVVQSSSGNPKGEQLFEGTLETPFYRTKKKAKFELFESAKEIGFTCIYDIELIKGVENIDGKDLNVFAFDAKGSVLAKRVICKKAEAEENKQAIKEYVDQTKVYYELYN